MVWTKRTAPNAGKIKRKPYEKRRGLYINCEIKKRDGKEASRHYFVRVPVPEPLSRRYTRNSVVRYLGTSELVEARKLAPAKVAAIRAEFAAMGRQNDLTADAARQIQTFETWRAHTAMVADPISGSRPTDDVDFKKLEADARNALAKIGLDPSPRNIGAAMDALYAGKIGATVLWDKGITPPQPAPLRVASAATISVGGSITEAAQDYATARDVKVTNKTRHQVKQSARLFGDHLAGVGVGAVTCKHAIAFLDRLATISPTYRHDPKAADMTLAELESKYPASEGGGLSTKTLNRHGTALRTIFERLIDRDSLPADHVNPFFNTHRQPGDEEDGTYSSMRDVEIAALLKAAPLAKTHAETFNDAVGWLVAVGAYEGMRAGETLALGKDDVLKKDGIHFFAIGKGKTKGARRFVPIHSALIAAGFLKYVATCEGKLFGIDAATLAKRFPQFRRDVFKATRIKERRGTVYHSLRKSFVSKLEHAGYIGDQIAPLVGHAGGKRSFTLDVYSPDGPLLNQRAIVVETIKYEGVKLSYPR